MQDHLTTTTASHLLENKMLGTVLDNCHCGIWGKEHQDHEFRVILGNRANVRPALATRDPVSKQQQRSKPNRTKSLQININEQAGE